MRSRTTAKFWKAYEGLPEHVRRQARVAFAIFEANPWHPGLHFKQVHATREIFSARVGLTYRALGQRVGDDEIVWFWIGSHADYDRLIGGF